MEKCPICGCELEGNIGKGKADELIVSCKNCGHFSMSKEFEDDIGDVSEDSLRLLSGYIRERNEYGKTDVLLTTENYKDILISPLIPHSIVEKYNKLLLYIYRHTRFLNDSVNLDVRVSTAVCYAKNRKRTCWAYPSLSE